MTNPLTFKPDWISPPGDTIQDAIDEMGISQAELARRLDVTKKHVNELIKGKAGISPDIAVRLELVLGEPARFWLQREVNYQQLLARKNQIENLKGESDWLKELPLSDMVKESWVRKYQNKGEQVLECLGYFEVATVEAWRNQTAELAPAYRASSCFPREVGAVAAWIKQCEHLSRNDDLCVFSKSSLKNACSELRALSLERDPARFIPALKAKCEAAGVSVVFCPAPRGCPISGAAWWPNRHNPVIGLSLRHKRNDHLWFTFFHEIAHLLLHDKKTKRIDWADRTADNEEKEEKEADQFARDTLIPQTVDFQVLLQTRYLSKKKVRSFAQSIGIAPGIVVGRLQHEGKLPYSHMNDLVIRYKWVRK